MTPPLQRWWRDRRGIAAVEFALIAPTLLLLLGGAADFGLVMTGKGRLANGLAQGVQYALLTGPGVTAANVQAAVKNGALRSGLSETVSVTVTGPACFCVSGTPAALAAGSTALSASNTCTSTCPVTGVASLPIMVVTASYLYAPLLPFYSTLANQTVTETITVRLK